VSSSKLAAGTAHLARNDGTGRRAWMLLAGNYNRFSRKVKAASVCDTVEKLSAGRREYVCDVGNCIGGCLACLEQNRRPVFAICISNFLPAATVKGKLPAIITGAAGESRFWSTCSTSPATSSSSDAHRVGSFDFSFVPSSVFSGSSFFDVPVF